MMFVKVFCGEEVIDLNISLILKVEKCTEGLTFERAIITDVLGNKYRSLSSYDDFLTKVQSNR
jgi:hypothetical protein